LADWQFRDDKKRGAKYFYITGWWTATRHFRKDVDKTFPAGKAGKAEISKDYQMLPNSIIMLHQLSGILELNITMDTLHKLTLKFRDLSILAVKVSLALSKALFT